MSPVAESLIGNIPQYARSAATLGNVAAVNGAIEKIIGKVTRQKAQMNRPMDREI
jgi:hypothetical protein